MIKDLIITLFPSRRSFFGFIWQIPINLVRNFFHELLRKSEIINHAKGREALWRLKLGNSTFKNFVHYLCFWKRKLPKYPFKFFENILERIMEIPWKFQEILSVNFLSLTEYMIVWNSGVANESTHFFFKTNFIALCCFMNTKKNVLALLNFSSDHFGIEPNLPFFRSDTRHDNLSLTRTGIQVPYSEIRQGKLFTARSQDIFLSELWHYGSLIAF